MDDDWEFYLSVLSKTQSFLNTQISNRQGNKTDTSLAVLVLECKKLNRNETEQHNAYHTCRSIAHPNASWVRFSQMAVWEDWKDFVRFLLKLFKHAQLFWKIPLPFLACRIPSFAPNTLKKISGFATSCKIWFVVAYHVYCKVPQKRWIERFAFIFISF